MADFGRLATEISIQYQKEQEKISSKNNANISQTDQNFFIQSSSIKSNRSHVS
jgi:hypothetical protein